jgi:hypothetical protein
VQQHPSPPQVTTVGESSAAIVAVLLERDEQQQKLTLERESRLEKQLTDAKTEIDQLREAAFGVREAALREQQVALLQSRLELLLSSKLLTEDELYVIEDVVADSTEAAPGDDRVPLLLALSAKMVTDKAFARQLKRKYC